MVTITLADKYAKLLACDVDVGSATATGVSGFKLTVTGEDVASAKTITLAFNSVVTSTVH